MRPSGLHQAIRGGIVATCEMILAALPLARLGAALPLRAVLPTLCALAIAGCATEPPPATPTILVPPPRAVEEPTRPPTWTAWPKPTEADPSMAELKAWYRALGEAGPVRGVSMSGLDERNHRIEIGLLPLRGVREEMEAAIARANVPREAVVIDVGCPDGALWRLDTGRNPGEEFLDAIDYSLEAVSKSPYGDTVSMKLKLRSTRHETVQFSMGGRPAHDFVVTTSDGEEVWNWQCAKIILFPLDRRILEPGEELEFTGEWEQVDNRGKPVPPGTYLIRGVLKMESPERLVTPPHKLRVRK